MAKEHEDFLSAYRKLEGLLRDRGLTVMEHEERIGEQEGHKLRLCRTIRNFLAHEDGADRFAAVSPAMLEFVRKEVLALDSGELPVKKRMLPIGKCLTESSTAQEAARFLLSRGLDAAPFFGGRPMGPAGEAGLRGIAGLAAEGAPMKSSRLKALSAAMPAAKLKKLLAGMARLAQDATVNEAEGLKRQGAPYIVVEDAGGAPLGVYF